MNENKEQWKEDFERILVSASRYSGNTKAGKKRISASQLNAEMLGLYLDFKVGKQTETKFEANSLGSIYQLGVDEAFKGKENYESALRLEHELPNGWVLSGEMDQIDYKNGVIIDNKVSTTTSKKKIIEEGKSHQYAIQLGVYKYLLNKHNSDLHFEGAIAFVDKNSSYFKLNTGDMLTLMNIETPSYEEIEKMAIEKTTILQEYLDLELEPERCKELFPFKSKGVTRPMKCIYYCSYNKSCRHAPTEFITDKYALDNISADLKNETSKQNPFDTTALNF